jgi:hypothetical protein
MMMVQAAEGNADGKVYGPDYAVQNEWVRGYRYCRGKACIKRKGRIKLTGQVRYGVA